MLMSHAAAADAALLPRTQIDVPMSNCINSGISKIYILTQFNSTSLNRHLARTYK